MVPVVFPDPTALWLFGLAALALLAIPGPAVLYIVVQSAEQGRRVGLASVAGIHVGTLVHVAAATVGLSALIVASAVAFSVVKYAGAAYLVYLGVRKLLERSSYTPVERREEPLRRAFVRGAIVNVLNPKTALFFLAFLPQFVDADGGGVWSQALVLGFVFVALGLVTDSLYAVAAGTVGGLIRRRRRALRYGSGLVYSGAALRTHGLCPGVRLKRPVEPIDLITTPLLGGLVRLDLRCGGCRRAVCHVSGDVDGAAFADDGHLYLARVLELILDLACDLM
jgi:threonine/homoserine/homoserine lactone efflux protein